MIKISPAEFVKSAGSKSGFIFDDRPQIVFAGKSNVGKSSVINSLLNRKNLARVGAAPGKTTNVNYFLIASRLWFVDLPGYGYARVSQQEKERWSGLMEDFFAARHISLGVQLVDARHKPTALDVMMKDLFLSCDCPFVVVANKLDKLKKSEIEPCLREIQSTLQLPEAVPLLAYSAEKGTGRGELLSLISAEVE